MTATSRRVAGSEAHGRLPDVASALPWRVWSEGLVEARQRTKPVLCLAEPAWANAAQRLALVLSRDSELRDLAQEAVVPVLVDSFSRPDLVARLRWSSIALTGTAGPPLLLVLDHRGRPLLSFCSMHPEGKEPYPSLASLLRSLEELYPTGGEASGAVGAPSADPLDADLEPSAAETGPEREWDDAFGGLLEEPKHPRPTLLWNLVVASERGDAGARERLRAALDALRRGGILDQLGGGFHRCSRDRRWVVPHFEKLGPTNAALAAVYARASRLFDDGDDLEVAEGAARFVLACLREGALGAGADTHFYTWYPEDVRDLLEPGLVQALGLHFALSKDPSRHTLYRAMDVEAMAEQAYADTGDMRERLTRGKQLLALHRAQRPPPERIDADAPSWRAEMVRWLLAATQHGLALPVDELVEHGRALWSGARDPSGGYPRGAGTYLEDQAAIGAAAIAAHRHGAEDALPAAHAQAEVIVASYLDPGVNGLSDVPWSRPDAQTSLGLADEPLPSPVGTAVGLLRALASDSGNGRFRTAADAAVAAHARAAGTLGARAATFHEASAAWRQRPSDPGRK